MANKESKVNQGQSKRVPRRISNEEKAYLLSIKREDITYSKMKELFAFRIDENNNDIPAKFLTNDRFNMNKNTLYNEDNTDTTVGRYIFNLFILSPKVLSLIGYQNNSIDKGGFGKLQGKISRLFLENKIDADEVIDFIDRCQWLGFSPSKFLIPSLTQQLLLPSDEIELKKKELLEKYKTAIENSDVNGVAKLEKELVEFAKTYNQSIPDMLIYESGVNSFKNSYKNASLLRGIIKNSGTGELFTSTSSLVGGIQPDEMDKYADLIVQASSSRALGTREGGYNKISFMVTLEK